MDPGASPSTREDKDRLIEQLRMELQAEKNKNKTLHEELRALREAQVQAQAATEQEEELITNTLMKRMNELKQDRDRLAMQVEQEEEYLTNTLQKKLRDLSKEKSDLEHRLEAEEEYIVNKLQRQLDDYLKEKAKLEGIVRSEHEEVEKLRQHSAQLTEALAKKTAVLEQERRQLAEQQTKLVEQIEILKREKVLSEQKAQKEHLLLKEVTHDKVQLELERERSDEREFNAQLVQKLEQAARAGTPVTRARSGSAAGLPLSPSLSGNISAGGGTGSPKKEHPGSLSISSSGSFTPSRTPALKLNLINTSAPLSPRLGISPRSSPHAVASPRSHMVTASPHLTATALHTSSVPHTPHASSPRLPRASNSSGGMPKSGKVLRQGWLRIRRPNDPHWTRQWCQLRDNEELWRWPETVTIVSDTPMDAPEAILDLDTVKAVRVLNESQDGHKFVFSTQRSDGVEFFSLESKEQLDEWCSLLRDLCPCLSK